ncbi:MAG: ABC transporter permease subunit [Planctomycetota bacterium]|jgi:ABC-type transport system involved in multi-copper enzyme maturation permease subunit
MTVVFSNLASHLTGLSWLAGPIFTKELRVSSRRKRNYVLRFAYLVLLTVFAGFVWFGSVNVAGAGSPVFQVSRMPEAGKHIITTIVWFQFLAAQLIAVVMLSAAVSDEIYRRTLGLLMTTPISSFQIVTGKLCSRLLQLVLLLALSLPLLAVVRVFGGVPWDYVFSAFCVTLTAAVFAGSISLLLSIYVRKAHNVVLRAILVCVALFAILPSLVRLLSSAYAPFKVPDSVILHTNPFLVMLSHTQMVISPTAGAPVLSWPLHCAIMICGSTFLLVLSTLSVRSAGLRQATGQAGMFLSRKEYRIARRGPAQGTTRTTAPRTIRRVKGPPVIWKEMKNPLIAGRRLKTVLTLTVALIVLSLAYGYCAYEKYLDKREVQMGFVLAYLFGGLFGATTAASSSITSEREARTWPILLTTALGETEIVLGKIIGSCLRAWPCWLLLAAHVILFTLARCIHPVAVLPLALVAFTGALLVSAVGVFFSSCFKRTSSAVVANLLSFFVFVLPVCCPLPVFCFGPLFVAAIILILAAGSQAAAAPFYGLEYQQLPFGVEDVLGAVAILIGIVVLYLFIGCIVFRITEGKIRSKIL